MLLCDRGPGGGAAIGTGSGTAGRRHPSRSGIRTSLNTSARSRSSGQEEYTQQGSNQQRQTLRSDILFMQDDGFGWVEFRDVAERDGLPVRDREERLLALFSKPNADRLKQAQRIVTEGARFNLDPRQLRLTRTINLPLTALRFLRAADQYRSSFKIAQWNRRTNLVSVEFVEQHQPRLIENAGPPRGIRPVRDRSRVRPRDRLENDPAERQHRRHDRGQVCARRECPDVAAALDGGTVLRSVRRLDHRPGKILAIPPVSRRHLHRHRQELRAGPEAGRDRPATIGPWPNRPSTGSRPERRAATPEVFWTEQARRRSSATSTRSRRIALSSSSTSTRSASWSSSAPAARCSSSGRCRARRRRRST